MKDEKIQQDLTDIKVAIGKLQVTVENTIKKLAEDSQECKDEQREIRGRLKPLEVHKARMEGGVKLIVLIGLVIGVVRGIAFITSKLPV